MPHNFNSPKIRPPKGARTFSGDIILERRGGDMWDKLKHHLENEAPIIDEYALRIMKDIEKEYGIDYVE